MNSMTIIVIFGCITFSPVFVMTAIRQYKITRGRQIVAARRQQNLIDIYEQDRAARSRLAMGQRLHGNRNGDGTRQGARDNTVGRRS
jgi:hypothetical protein